MPADDARYVLRFLSGPHAGTEVVLGLGAYILGSDEQDDLIIRDPDVAARHLLLDLAPEGLSAEPREASFFLDGRKIWQGRVPVAPFQVITAGFTSMALAPQGQPWPDIALPRIDQSGEAVDDPEVDEQPSQTEQHDPPEQTRPAVPEALPDNVGQRPPWMRHPGLFWLLLSGLGLALVGLWLIFFPSSSALAPQTEQTVATYPWVLLEDVIKTLGLDNLRIVEDINEQYSVIGHVQTVDQRRELRMALRQLPFPVNMHVVVIEQMIHSIQDVLRILGLQMEVEDLGDGRLRLFGFISDDAVTLRLVQRLADDIPGLDNIHLDVVKFQDVFPKLSRKLRKEGMADQIALEPNPGWIKVSGALNLEDRLLWSRIKESLAESLGMEIPFREDFTFPDPRDRIAQPSNQASATVQHANPIPPAPPGLRIQSISTQPTPTFITKDGLRYFIGATLPDGSEISDITMRRIVLFRNGHRITLPTGGN